MTIKEQAINVLCKKSHELFGDTVAELGPDTRFDEDLHVKSTNLVQYSAALEDEFEIEVPFMTIKKMKTFGEVGDWMDKQVNG